MVLYAARPEATRTAWEARADEVRAEEEEEEEDGAAEAAD
jgi:hypothetical protein